MSDNLKYSRRPLWASFLLLNLHLAHTFPKTVFVVHAQQRFDNNCNDNGILASITLPTADGIKCDYRLPFFCIASDNTASAAGCVTISNVS